MYRTKFFFAGVVVVLFLFLIHTAAFGDEKLYLKDGRTFEGKLVELTQNKVRFLFKRSGMSSELEFDIKEVSKITQIVDGVERDMKLVPEPPRESAEPEAPKEEAPAPKIAPEEKPAAVEKNEPKVDVETEKDSDYKKKVEELNVGISRLHLALASWCQKNGKPLLAEKHYREALALDPSCREAGEALGLINHDGKWVTVEEMEKIEAERQEQLKITEELESKGYVNLAGVWITAKLKSMIEEAPTNQRFNFLLILQRYRDAKDLTSAELLGLEPDMLELWDHLAPNEQMRICPSMVGKQAKVGETEPQD